ncbi:hypothetical protein [Sphingopyxis solisilvae]|uniref:hypothetical protein n=1 Tax=Sphingopyxis solisilvae TaxID=1886788 RepID=UPI001892974A|nr:hypothetical protein [Sphingopyxis solisilvae]
MKTAEQRLIAQRDRYVAAVTGNWRGYERELLIALVRALDFAAYIHCIAKVAQDGEPGMRMRGAATALRPLLQAVADMPGAIPWAPSPLPYEPAFDNHLATCGRFAASIRLAAMERYGLAETKVVGDRILIEVAPDVGERIEVEAGHAANARAREALLKRHPHLAVRNPEIRRRLERYGKVVDGWFIGYDNDQVLVDHYRAHARIEAAGTVEAEALPLTAPIGGRLFGDWSEASTVAYGAVLHHIDAAGCLCERMPKLNPRDLLTIFARREDIVDVLMERGDDHAGAQQLMEGLTLDAEGAAWSEGRHEIPLPYYIDAGKHFVLLPTFGGLMNSHAGLLDHLRRKYRADWDKIVDGREDVFREDLRRLLPEPRYKVLEKGLKLRRKDKSILTDADAVVLDHHTGVVIFVQMKWYDVHGFSLAERDSRRENLLTKGNEWVDKVHGWIDGRTCAQIAQIYNWGVAADVSPEILVMARHSTRFAGETRYDPRANWTTWHALTEEMHDPACEGFVAGIVRSQNRKPKRQDFSGTTTFELPGMVVEVRTRD